jgi:hypothetical protein
MSIEAMKQAVEAFEHIKKYVTDDGAMPENWDAYHEKEYFALEALRQAIEQAEKQEPVTWAETNDMVCALLRQAHDVLACASYPFKRPWVSLTDEELYLGDARSEEEIEYARAIEAKLREKNNG